MSALLDKLLKEGLVTQDQIKDARDKQLGAKRPLHELLVDMGFVAEEAMMKFASEVFKMPIVSLDVETKLDQEALKMVPYEMAKRYGIFPLGKDNGVLMVATSDPEDVIALDDLRLICGGSVKTVLASKSHITQLIERAYQGDEDIYDLMKNFTDDVKVDLARKQSFGHEAIDVSSSDKERSPAVKLVNMVLWDAIKMRASDIHIEPQERHVSVRYRIDGELKDIMKVPVSIYPAISARVKIVGDLDIAETRKMQDGRVRVKVNDRNIDLRVSVMPTFFGEKIELRVLDFQEAKFDINKIGFDAKDFQAVVDAIHRPQGMILVTGPTGSGKTSTLYALLNSLKGEEKNITTIEDPVEYLIEGINQTQVNLVKDVTFVTGLRSILRQDPDVILVGEIRDKETAEIAIRSSLTGHLVFSTLHTNNSVASIARLQDIGVEPYLIATAVIMVLSQRLVKCNCESCKEPYTPDAKLLENLKAYLADIEIKTFYKGKGCKKCNYTGFYGRMPIFEILPIDSKLTPLIQSGASELDIMRAAREHGLIFLIESGLKKVAEGRVTLEEVASVADFAMDESMIHKQKEAAPSSGIKILAADDEEDILKVVVKRLVDAGYNVVRARDGEELVALAIKEKPDLIVSDVTMPKMNGFEAAAVLKNRLETASIPILMLTARQDKESEIQGISSGADDYMTKPFDKDKFLARVKMLLRRKG